jgi:aspartyl-tRNA(Asn)/glutamyl-tRNA(Gln) amidotransferase subunit A
VRLAAARASDERRVSGQAASALDGVPIAVKDVLATKGLPDHVRLAILEGWVPPYDATVVAKVRAAGLPILGKTNMDEFAMGSSTEHSAYGVTHNPWDLTRIPGGSGGGSAAAVAAFEAPIALGTDTGGSIRQPGAVTGTVGVKPTVRRRLALRPGRAGQLARPGRPGDPDRPRRGAAARDHRRPRPQGLHLDRPAGARAGRGARQGATGDLAGRRGSES